MSDREDVSGRQRVSGMICVEPSSLHVTNVSCRVAHSPCECGDNLDRCDTWDLAGCTPD